LLIFQATFQRVIMGIICRENVSSAIGNGAAKCIPKPKVRGPAK
jgi:hypothetical protein